MRVRVPKEALWKAIRKKCIDCNGGSHKGVRECTDRKCPLFPFRMGEREKNRKKLEAGKILNDSIKNGLITRPEICQRCGKKTKLEGHHEDYSKPLDVIWLCKSCHTKTRFEPITSKTDSPQILDKSTCRKPHSKRKPKGQVWVKQNEARRQPQNENQEIENA